MTDPRRPSKAGFGWLLVVAAAAAYLVYEVVSGLGLI